MAITMDLAPAVTTYPPPYPADEPVDVYAAARVRRGGCADAHGSSCHTARINEPESDGREEPAYREVPAYRSRRTGNRRSDRDGTGMAQALLGIVQTASVRLRVLAE